VKRGTADEQDDNPHNEPDEFLRQDGHWFGRNYRFIVLDPTSCLARPALLRVTRFGGAQTLSRNPAIARVRSSASGGWRARQDSSALATREACRGVS
jgi:hypothetical protein